MKSLTIKILACIVLTGTCLLLTMWTISPHMVRGESDMTLIEQEILDYLKKHYDQAQDFYRQGALEDALIEFQKVSDIDPGYENVGEHVGNIKKAMLVGGAPKSGEQGASGGQNDGSRVSSMAVKAQEVNVRADEINIYADRFGSKGKVADDDLDSEAKEVAQEFVKEEIGRQKQQDREQQTAEKTEQQRRKLEEKKRIAEEKADAKKKQQIEASLAQGKKHFNEGELDNAGKEFDRVLALDPKNATARGFASDLQKHMGRREQMEESQSLFDEQKYDLALVNFENILKDDPGNAAARDYIRKIHNAKAEQTKAVRRQTMDHLLREGQELFGAGQFDMAIQIWDDALEMGPPPELEEELQAWRSRAELAKSQSGNFIFENTGLSGKETKLTDVNQSSVPTTEFSPGWTEGTGIKAPRQSPLYISPDKQKLLDALAVRYSVEFNNANLTSVIETLTALTGLNIVIDTAAISKDVGQLAEVLQAGAITLKVKDMPLIDLMDAVLRFTNLAYSIEENMIWITSRDQVLRNGLEIVVFDVSDLVRKLHDFPSKGLEGISTSAGSAEGTAEE